MPRKPRSLSQPLTHKLNLYALSATAAGVGSLVFAQPAEAKVIYAPAHVVLDAGETYKLDLNNDGVVDFGLQIYTCTTNVCTTHRKEFRVYGHASGANSSVVGITGSTAAGGGIAAALQKGSIISGKSHVFGEAVLVGENSGRYLGNWFPNVKNRYLSLTFYLGGEKHYGWARVSVRTRQHPFEITGVLTGYAYETIPNKPIVAGKTKGPDVITVQPTTLGHLARGASSRQ